MISESHIGRSYPPTPPYVVSAAKVAEFAAALGERDNPHYAGADAVAPPTFAVVLSSAAWRAMFDDPELELSLSRTVHTDQRFAWRRPLRVGDAVTASLTIEKFRARGSSAFITVVVGLDADGERVCDATSTLLHTWPDAPGEDA
ncbi:MaoC family dehydratase N-terminal domain-containing protein [Micropruina sonneratiae]|uniref:MaoC family dehydratase N-terminal domain-containing protein n=1 Tax=Micropruina sonneratiae TaxID=2986940 RepID=UPI0022273503|nr:MaoC family dehydratase N-terminal domain-containing protein [Micropruina sp. KQZ13P-5]MCW3158123.1 MaoC family dehydratase N-terminal domain-containing protein [Micropruina sp. KQZ13P-5]